MERTRRHITYQTVRWNTSKSQDSSLQIMSKIKIALFFSQSCRASWYHQSYITNWCTK